MRILFPCKIINKANFEKHKPMLIVANHLSNIDPVYMYEYFAEKKFFLCKKELFKNKFFGRILKCLCAIPIDRQKTDITALKNSLKVLKENKKLVVFPEGTRNKDNTTLQPIKNGTALFAIKAQVPILPMWIEKRGKILKRNKLVVGQPFELSEFYDKKLDEQTLNNAGAIIFEKLSSLGDNQQQ